MIPVADPTYKPLPLRNYGAIEKIFPRNENVLQDYLNLHKINKTTIPVQRLEAH